MIESNFCSIAKKAENLIEIISQKHRIGTKAIKEFLSKEIKAFLTLVLIGVITFCVLVFKVGIARELYSITIFLLAFDATYRNL